MTVRCRDARKASTDFEWEGRRAKPKPRPACSAFLGTWPTPFGSARRPRHGSSDPAQLPYARRGLQAWHSRTSGRGLTSMRSHSRTWGLNALQLMLPPCSCLALVTCYSPEAVLSEQKPERALQLALSGLRPPSTKDVAICVRRQLSAL